MSKNINDISLANLKHYEGKWQSGKTRTIRVPIALADVTLSYARQLDNGTKSPDTSDLTDEVKQLKDEVERLQTELGNLRTQAATSPPELELLEAAELLNRLKAKRKKVTASLADIEALLEMMRISAPKGK